MRRTWDWFVPSCRTSICLLGLFAAITLGADAHAQSPSRPAQAVAYVLSKRTLAMQYDHMDVRIDLAVPAIAVNIPEGYFRFVGTSGMMHFNGPNYAIPAPVPVSAEHAARITEFFAELNAGFPNTVFTEGEHPGQIVPDYYLGSHGSVGWYGVHLPFTWVQGYRVYLQVGGNGTPAAVAVFDSAGQPLRYGKLINTSRQSLTFSDVGIPFPPDVYATERPTVRPPPYVPEHLRRGGARPYHEEITRMRLLYDYDVSNGRTLSGRSIKGLSIDHLACPQAPKVTRLPGTLVWTLSEDPAEQQRLLDAAAVCPVKFQMTMTASHIAAAGQKTCLSGTWTVLDTSVSPPAIRWSKDIAECKNGPVAEDVPWKVAWDLPPGSDPTFTEVRFDGEVELRCQQVTTKEASAVLRMEGERQPIFTWTGCYPGWSTQVP